MTEQDHTQEHEMLLDKLNLERLLTDMDVPEIRKTDYHWLARNLGVRNGDHADYNAAMGYIKRLVK